MSNEVEVHLIFTNLQTPDQITDRSRGNDLDKNLIRL